MKYSAATNPEAFITELTDWRRAVVELLQAAILRGHHFDQAIKWGNLVFFANGRCILIHVEEHRIVLGFWRGKQLVELDPRLKPGGKYELANLVIHPDTEIDPDQIAALARAAAALNLELGDPALAAHAAR